MKCLKSKMRHVVRQEELGITEAADDFYPGATDWHVLVDKIHDALTRTHNQFQHDFALFHTVMP